MCSKNFFLKFFMGKFLKFWPKSITHPGFEPGTSRTLSETSTPRPQRLEVYWQKIVFCLNYFTANDQEKQVKCNLIFPQGAKVEKRTASKSFLKARPKAEPSECLRAGLFSTEAPWGKIKLHETGFSVSFQLKNNSNRMFFWIYWTFLKILK